MLDTRTCSDTYSAPNTSCMALSVCAHREGGREGCDNTQRHANNSRKNRERVSSTAYARGAPTFPRQLWSNERCHQHPGKPSCCVVMAPVCVPSLLSLPRTLITLTCCCHELCCNAHLAVCARNGERSDVAVYRVCGILLPVMCAGWCGVVQHSTAWHMFLVSPVNRPCGWCLLYTRCSCCASLLALAMPGASWLLLQALLSQGHAHTLIPPITHSIITHSHLC